MTGSHQTAYDHSLDFDDDVSDKNRLVAFVLAFLFGVFGVHRFYVGKVGTGALMLVLDLTLVGFAITGIWATIDCVFIALGEFTDADGYRIVEWS